MKLKELWNWLTKGGEKKHEIPPQIAEDTYAMIKHTTKTRSLGSKSYGKHNNRKRTRGRRIQYMQVGKYTKPIYHGAK